MSAGNINLGLESVKSMGGKVIQAAIGFSGMLLFSRIVEKSEFGGFYLLLALVILWNRPLGGFNSAIEKRWSEEDSPKEKLFGSIVFVNLIGLAITGILAYIFGDALVSYTNLEGAPLLFIILFSAFLFFNPFQSLLSAEGWPSKNIWNDTLRSILTLPLQVILVIGGMGALGMGYGLAGATFLAALVPLYFVKQRPTIPDKDVLHSLWEYARFSSLGEIVGKAYDRMDILLLGFFIGTASVANYEVALKLTLPATFISGPIGTAIRPKISNAVSKGEDVSQDITHALGYASALSIPIFFGALALPEPLVVTAYGPKYSDAAPYLIGLALYQVFTSQSSIYRWTLAGMDYPDVNLNVSLVTLVVNIVLGLTLLFVIGPLGIVISTIASEALQYVLSMRGVVKRTNDIEVLPRPLQYQILSGLVMFVGVELLQRMMGIQSWVDLVALVSAGGLIYGLLLISISPEVRLTARAIYNDAT